MIKGVEKLEMNIARRIREMGMRVSTEMLKIANETAAIARENAPEGRSPRREPRLKDCFGAEGGYLAARAYVVNPHATYVEFGTGQRGAAGGRYTGGYDGDWAGMSPQPYMYPAAQAMKGDYANRLGKAAAGG